MAFGALTTCIRQSGELQLDTASGKNLYYDMATHHHNALPYLQECGEAPRLQEDGFGVIALAEEA